MDTKGVKFANWKRLYYASRCGEKRIGITTVGTFPFTTTCKNWDCPDCVKGKISNIRELLNQHINGPHVFISHIEDRERQLSNWITRHKRRDRPFFYLAIQTATGTFFISNILFSDHPSLFRKSKRKYIDKELPESLTEHHREVTKVSHSRINEGHGGDHRLLLAILYDTTLDEEYEKLETDIEKAEWLVSIVNSGKGMLTKLGREFIRQHLGDQAL